jgi:hypothetical protein
MGGVKLRVKSPQPNAVRVVALTFFMAGTACGGKSAAEESHQPASGGSSAIQAGAANVAGSTANGGAANGGAASVGTGASAGAGPISTCPAAVPVAGAACRYAGDQCNYAVDRCSSVGFICTNGVWVQQGNNDGAALTCFNFSAEQGGRPNDGDSCACRGMLDCTFDECSTNGSVHAVCDNTTWHVTTQPCADTPCGTSGLSCKQGEACVVRPNAQGADYQCVADPCADQAQTLSCDCAASLCHSPTERCMMNSGKVECLCDTC